jgi:hypothetical protein
VITLAGLAAVSLSGCGEKPNVTVYKQGQYQGKPDNVPWQSAPFNNNQVEWEKSIKARNNNQNEYLRVGTN